MAKQLIDSGRHQRFYEMCGDQFISGYAPGGDLFGVIRVSRKDSMFGEIDSIGGSAGLDLGFFKIGGGGSKTTQTLSKFGSENVSVSVIRTGGNGKISKDETMTMSGLIAAANEFPEKIKNASWPVAFEIQNYDIVENLHPNAKIQTFPNAVKAREDLQSMMLHARIRRAVMQNFDHDYEESAATCNAMKKYGYVWKACNNLSSARVYGQYLDKAHGTVGSRPKRKRSCKQIKQNAANLENEIANALRRCEVQPGTCTSSKRRFVNRPGIWFEEYANVCRPPLRVKAVSAK